MSKLKSSNIKIAQYKLLPFVALLLLMTSCAAWRSPYASRFVTDPPGLGMDKDQFVGIYGAPFRQNVFYDEDNAYCEELIYREKIDHGGTTFTQGEERAINSIFLFKNGKLVSQFQEDDADYQLQLERNRERRLIKEQIDAEKARAAAEQERIAIEKERIKAEKEKKEGENN